MFVFTVIIIPSALYFVATIITFEDLRWTGGEATHTYMFELLY